MPQTEVTTTEAYANIGIVDNYHIEFSEEICFNTKITNEIFYKPRL